MKKKVIAVIPARMGSSRFPGKPLVSIAGIPMVEHVRRRALLAKNVDEVVVATCDQEIVDTVMSFGGKAVMTSDSHERCTDRVEEACRGLHLDIAVIVQGDEPLFLPEVLDLLIEPLLASELVKCTNLLSRIQDEKDLDEADIVKAAINLHRDVMFFSRAPIPFRRVKSESEWFRQTGLSAFTREFLATFSALEPTPLEITESVDFLRILEHGYPIRGVVFDQETVGVDRETDVTKVEARLEKDPQQKAIYERIRD